MTWNRETGQGVGRQGRVLGYRTMRREKGQGAGSRDRNLGDIINFRESVQRVNPGRQVRDKGERTISRDTGIHDDQLDLCPPGSGCPKSALTAATTTLQSSTRLSVRQTLSSTG